MEYKIKGKDEKHWSIGLMAGRETMEYRIEGMGEK